MSSFVLRILQTQENTGIFKQRKQEHKTLEQKAHVLIYRLKWPKSI